MFAIVLKDTALIALVIPCVERKAKIGIVERDVVDLCANQVIKDKRLVHIQNKKCPGKK